MGGKPQRASQMESDYRKKGKELKVSEMDDGLGWDLGGKSTINNKKGAKVEDSLGFDLIGDSNISKKKKDKMDIQDFGNIG